MSDDVSSIRDGLDLEHVEDSLPRLRTVEDLYSDPSLTSFPEVLVPHLARRGCTTLLAGAPKAGKTTLALNALAALARGEPFLGEPVNVGAVLWASLDEPEPILVDRLRRLDVPVQTNCVRFLLRRDLKQRFTPGILREYLKQSGASLVVLDTLGRIAQASGIDIARGDQLLPWLTPFIEVVREFDAGCLMLAHTTKSGERYKGAVELEGEVDAPLILRPRGERDALGEDTGTTATLRRLEGMTRWGEVSLDLASPDGLHYVIGDGDASLLDRALGALLSSEGPVSVAALAKQLGRRKADVRQALATLEKRGQATRIDGGWRAVLDARHAP